MQKIGRHTINPLIIGPRKITSIHKNRKGFSQTCRQRFPWI